MTQKVNMYWWQNAHPRTTLNPIFNGEDLAKSRLFLFGSEFLWAEGYLWYSYFQIKTPAIF